MNGLSRLAAGAIAWLALPAMAQDAPGDAEVYAKAVDCGALHGFFAGALEETDPDEAYAHEEISERYFVMAYSRDGGDGEDTDAAIADALDELLGTLEELESSEAQTEAYLAARSARCGAFNLQVKDEFDAIELED